MNHKTIVILITLLLSAQAFSTEKKAADFSLVTIDGENFNLRESLERGPVLIDFWATWCKPCKQALPEIDRIRAEYSDQGLQVVTISTDNPRGVSKVKSHVRSSKYGFEVLLDTDEEVRKLFGGKTIPLTVLIASNGDIVYRHLGYSPGDEKELIQAVEDLLLQSKPEDTPVQESNPEGGDN